METKELNFESVHVTVDKEVLSDAVYGWVVENTDRVERMSRIELVSQFFMMAARMEFGDDVVIHTDGRDFLSIRLVDGISDRDQIVLFGDMRRDLLVFNETIMELPCYSCLTDIVCCSEVIAETVCETIACMAMRTSGTVGIATEGHATVQEILLSSDPAESISIAAALTDADLSYCDYAEYLWSVYQTVCQVSIEEPSAYISMLGDFIKYIPFDEIQNPFFRGAILDFHAEFDLNSMASMLVSGHSLRCMGIEFIVGCLINVISESCLEEQVELHPIPTSVYLSALALLDGGSKNRLLENRLVSDEEYELFFFDDKKAEFIAKL